MWRVFCVHEYPYTMCVLGAHEGQKSATLELGIQMISSFWVDDGNLTQVFCKSSQCS